MDPAAAKALVPGLLEGAEARGVRFPAHWLDDADKKEMKKTVMSFLLSCHKEDGSGFDEDMTMSKLEERFGIKEKSSPPAKKGTKRSADGDAAAAEGGGGGGGGGSQESGDGAGSPKKAKKKETMACEENRAAAMVLQEIADLYWKNKDTFKGVTFGKAAKALRECETYCSNSKEACKLKGIGKSCGALIEEVIKTGKSDKLEKLRAGEL